MTRRSDGYRATRHGGDLDAQTARRAVETQEAAQWFGAWHIDRAVGAEGWERFV
ncbi:MAG: hypothetical protein JWM76_3093 [Pseudonocardiales bacterium]|nr:hypothetical protein [Pseudonocardiales bacterium]